MDRNDMKRLLVGLPDLERKVVLMVIDDGLNDLEVAAVTGLSAEAVHATYAAAVGRMDRQRQAQRAEAMAA